MLQDRTPISSVSDVFVHFEGAKGVARLIGKGHSTASEMKRRRSIPVEYWPALIGSEKGREIGLSAEDLMRMHADKPAPEAPAPREHAGEAA